MSVCVTMVNVALLLMSPYNAVVFNVLRCVVTL